MNTDRPFRWSHGLAALVAAAALLASGLLGGLGNLHTAPAPFVWRDVALVCFLAALPLAASVSAIVYFHALPSHRLIAVLALEALVVLLVPWLYIQARCQHDSAMLSDLMEQSRLSAAHLLASRLATLHPRGDIYGYPLRRVASDLHRAVHERELRAASPLPADATDDERLVRARDLAILDRTAEALAVLQSSPLLSSSPVAENLRATIYETRSNWPAALAAYNRAGAAWRPLADSADRTAGLAQAATGIAYCQRKLGRWAEAQAAYQELIQLTPSADSHFLLAQFYEDAQQTARAEHHARQAQRLNPQKFSWRASRLLDRLQTSHFGCFAVGR